MEDTRDDSRLIHRLVLRNYKSIAACDVRLRPLTFLVGPNGAGKSNVLDALRFVADALRNSLDQAIRERDGIWAIRHRNALDSAGTGIRLEFRLPDNSYGYYAFDLDASEHGEFSILNEVCWIKQPEGSEPDFYHVAGGEVIASTMGVSPAAVSDRLYLVNASGIPAFRPVYDALSGMGFYNLNPGLLRELQRPDPGDLLARDGSNVSSVLARLDRDAKHAKRRINEYLAQVVPGIVSVRSVPAGNRETIAFRQTAGPYQGMYLGASMSDGTLRALGVLVALFQGAMNGNRHPLLVGIEEPETALHPAAAEVLVDSLRDASGFRQVLVTSHSPDLLDHESIADDEILAVIAEDGETRIGPLDEAGRSTLRDHLYTAGALLRMNQLRPDSGATLTPDDVDLFGEYAE